MILCSNIITTNSEQPFIIVNTDNLTKELQNKIEQSQIQKIEYVIVTNEDVNQLFEYSNNNEFPITIDGYLQFVSD